MSSAMTLDRTLDALANEHRREIVDLLATGPVATPALNERFAMSKQALNKHLVVLEAAGLIERRLQGRVHELRLQTQPLDIVDGWLGEIRRGWQTSFDRLGDLLEGDKK